MTQKKDNHCSVLQKKSIGDLPLEQQNVGMRKVLLKKNRGSNVLSTIGTKDTTGTGGHQPSTSKTTSF
ncbi:MAG: hypothetical protein GY820_31025 [Gammaproteobacteria bacterium]|nr:hypothetical protein [Gammaproteobacteria bacterium]